MRVILVIFLILSIVCNLIYTQVINEAELKNDALVKRRIRCALETGPCDRTGSQLKAVLPEVLKRNCRKCTPKQKETARRLMKLAEQKYPKEWAQIKAKYS